MLDLADNLLSEGEHSGLIQGPAGFLEVILDVPPNANHRYFAILGHPHSLQGGTMNNKVVTTMVRVFRDLGIPSIRFNFRGVGRSAGVYDSGIGESEDMLHILRLCGFQDVTVLFAGFSFGSYVAFRAVTYYQMAHTTPTALITIAPPVHHYDYSQALAPKTPWIVVQGMDDEVVPVSLVSEFAQQHSHELKIEYFLNTGHFFHGKLLELKSRLMDIVYPWVKLR